MSKDRTLLIALLPLALLLCGCQAPRQDSPGPTACGNAGWRQTPWSLTIDVKGYGGQARITLNK